MKFMNMKRQACPRCGYQMDTAECFLEPKADPKPGDISICMNCGDLLKFLFDLSFAVPTSDEEVNIYLTATPKQLKLLRVTQAFIKKRGRIKKNDNLL